MKYTYDPEAKASYFYLVESPRGKVGCLGVSPGNIHYRKPSKSVPFDGWIVLDFDTAGFLVGVEVLGDNLIHPSFRSDAQEDFEGVPI